jgi:hypothetical protein
VAVEIHSRIVMLKSLRQGSDMAVRYLVHTHASPPSNFIGWH